MSARPDKQRRKDLLHDWASKRRAEARAKFPLPDEQLRALFDFLRVEISVQGCEHDLRLVEWWLHTQGLPIEPVIAWLHSTGGYCDCEAASNSYQAWQSANKDVDW
jgi:hypothetical protein